MTATVKWRKTLIGLTPTRKRALQKTISQCQLNQKRYTAGLLFYFGTGTINLFNGRLLGNSSLTAALPFGFFFPHITDPFLLYLEGAFFFFFKQSLRPRLCLCLEIDLIYQSQSTGGKGQKPGLDLWCFLHPSPSLPLWHLQLRPYVAMFPVETLQVRLLLDTTKRYYESWKGKGFFNFFKI